MVSSLLLFVWALTFSTLACGQSLIAVDVSDGYTVSQLADKYVSTGADVRGQFKDFILVVGEVADSESEVALFPYLSTYTYVVLEEQQLDFAFEQVALDVSAATFSYQKGASVIVGVENELVDGYLETVPFNYEVLRVAESPRTTVDIAGTKYDEFFADLNRKIQLAPPDPLITFLINQVTTRDLTYFTTHLSGENSTIQTRQAQSTGAVSAQNFIQQTWAANGFTTSTHAFRAGFSSNVIGDWRGTTQPNRYVLITAHYDSRAASSSSTTARAPGANDNGSGTGALLQISKILHLNRPRFAYSIRLVAFSGEEQGLLGSAAYAELMRSSGVDIVAVLNADMIGYRSPSEQPQLAFASRSSTPSLNTLLTSIAREYVPSLTVGTSTACCTDHASFYDRGFQAASYFERNGNIADPMYHNVGDLVYRTGYDINNQYPAITRAVLAGAATIALIST